MKNIDALKIATIKGTEALGLDNDLGSLESSFYVGGKLNFDNSFVKSGNMSFRHFGDDRDSRSFKIT